MAAKFGLAVNATVAPRSVFARKNYFYPDLPKGYQISQYELPIVEHGELFIKDADGNDKRIGITRAHLEEDAGKSIHAWVSASRFTRSLRPTAKSFRARRQPTEPSPIPRPVSSISAIPAFCRF